MKTPGLPLFLLFLSLTGISYASDLETIVQKVKENMRPLTFSRDIFHSEEELEFFDHYGLSPDDTAHHFGSLKTDTHDIATHVFEKDSSGDRNVILLHGYYDNSGYMKNLITPLLEEGFRVISFDLPGHGLSSGESAAINDFSEYSNALKKVLQTLQENFEGDVSFVAHSTGCATLLEFLRQGNANPFKKVVLAAPLVRSKLYDISKWGHLLFARKLPVVPRFLRRNSGDQEFLDFVKNDPLQYRRFPMVWLRALIRFNNSLDSWEGADGSRILVIQGEQDGTVEWKRNLPILQEKLPGLSLEMHPDAEHQLFNEKITIRQKVIDQTLRHLE